MVLTEEEIDDLIDEWHEDPTDLRPLSEVLGMTWNEYSYFTERGYSAWLNHYYS